MSAEEPLRIAFLTYRGNPHSGGQGVYARHLTRALVDLGHSVEVFSGQPYPELDARVPLHRLPSFDLYNAAHPWRIPHPRRWKTLGDWIEIAQFATLAFPEPLAFSVRAARALQDRVAEFDLAHDNQCLGYGLAALARRLPVIATIHHPITVDLRLELARAATRRRRFLWRRWYAFTKMQRRMARRIDRIVTDSESSRDEIENDLGVPRERLHVVPVGVDPAVFRPLPDVAPVPGRIVTAASADSAMKGLIHLLEAVAELRSERPVELVVVGKLREDGPTARRIAALGLGRSVRFETGISEERLVELHAEAEVAVVPSLFEGFSLPAVEAMSCGTPLVATTGGALPEVVGRDGDTALLVPPGDSAALARCLASALGRPDLRETVGRRGRARVLERWTWRQTALGTVAQYRALLAGRRERSPLRA
jgi:glycosyltransferase involved in cell wall biosynthesis